jgi:hypothetical protein
MLNHQGCYDIGNVQHHAGVHFTPASTSNATGAKANIAVSFPNFITCSSALGSDGVSAWVAVAPGPTNPNGSQNAIVQVGIIRCNSPFNASCTNNEPRYFWARGGCGANIPVPFDLGSATSGNHNFRVKRDTSPNRYEFFVDDEEVDQILAADDAIDCWIAGDKEAQVIGETLDTGDINGRSSAKDSYDHMRAYRNGSWEDIGGSCGVTTGNTHHPMTCQIGWTSTTGTWMLTWSQ